MQGKSGLFHNTRGDRGDKLTNREKLQALDTWELAEWILKVSNNQTKITTCESLCDDCEASESFCVSGIVEWLQEEEE